MRKFLLGTLMLIFCSAIRLHAQDFSNKGKEFWLAYSYHVGMVNSGNSPTMTLYITSDVATTYNVEIFGVTTLASGNINAGQVVTLDIPTNYFINAQGVFSSKAIRVTAARPVVVYSYITRSQASAATLCLPTAVLGREYISMNYKQVANENNAHSYITIVAVEDNTSVEITPSVNTNDPTWLANTTRTINLNKGQIYQVLGKVTLNTGEDLTGSTVRSVASAGGGCKRIAVFSGSGKISIGCGANGGSSDNLYQQLYPVASWGKKYLTVPSFNRPNAIYRIIKSVASANVYLNGVLIPAVSFTNNVYHEFANSTPNRIESDQPISVAQFFTTQGCNGNGSPYDPDMIMLNPVEQNIDKVTLVSSSLIAEQNRQHHLQVIIKNSGTALSSFKLDGAPVPTGSWTVHNADPTYSYIYLSNLAQGYHTLASDTGFNALAYGYADAETYGYSAGSNIKDLYQYVSLTNEYATVDFPAACKGSPFSLSMTFPYQPTQIIWQFNGLFPDLTINNPPFTSSSVVNGRTIYKYNLPGTFSVPTVGSYPIKIVAQNPTSDGCSGEQEIEYELQVFNPPVADFNFTTNGCVSSPVTLTDNTSNSSTRPIAHWYWSFGDNATLTGSGNSNTSHNFPGAGSYNVKYTVITDVGCKSADTAAHIITLNEPPVAGFTTNAPFCAGKTITFKDVSTVTGATIAKWYWNFGDNTPVVTATTNADQTHTYNTPGTYNVTLQVETSLGCLSTVFPRWVIISPNPVVDFSLPNVCLPAGVAQFNSLSTISDGSQNLFNYVWDFGDASTTGNTISPIHNYTGVGPFNVSLTVTSNNGCAVSTSKSLTTVYSEPKAAFSAPLEVCLGTAINFADQSNAPGSTVTGWQWNFGDATGSNDKNPVKIFAAPGIYTITLSVTSAVGCQTVSPASIATRTVIVNALPGVDFNTSLPGCANQGLTFNNASIANAGNLIKWTWTFGDATTTVRSDGNPFTHTYAAVNTYNVGLQVETDKGCVSRVLSKPVQIHAVPVAAFTPPDICVSDVATAFIEASTITTGNVSGWEWNFGDERSTGANPNTSTVRQPAHHYTLPGEYTAQLIAISDAGCRDTLPHTFTVNGAVLTPQFIVENTGVLCSNKEVIIRDASQVDAGKIIRVEIFWDDSDLNIKTIDNNPFTGKVYTHSYPEFGAPASKVYKIRYDIYSGSVCVNSITKQITVLSTPTIALDAALPVCTNSPSFQLSAHLLNGLPGSGAFSGAGVSTSGLFNPAVAGAGTRSIVYTYNATNGCSNSVTKTIMVNPTPIANAGPDRVVLEGGVVVLTPVLITNIPVSYNWAPPTWLSNPAIAKPEASPPTDFTYTLKVTSDKGCTTSDDVFVKLLKYPIIPNIFSPNGDGIHDRWEIEYLESYPGCVVQLYNRYGQMVYQIVNYNTPWDGKINGKDAPVGTYYYIIDPKNGRKPMTGYVDIIR